VSYAGLSRLQKFVTNLNDCGYYSILLPYYSLRADSFIKAARILKEDEKIKFMIALRPRALSPEYCAMLCNAFSLIQKNRLMINIVHGSVEPGELQRGILGQASSFSSREEAIKYTESFVKALVKETHFNQLGVDLVLSGGKAETIGLSKAYADYSVIGYDNITDGSGRYKDLGVEHVMTNLSLVIRDSEKECKDYKDLYPEDENLLVATPEDLPTIMSKLSSLGVTDVMLYNHKWDEYPNRAHDFVSSQNRPVDFFA
jgi:hypothetical protein